MDSEHIVKSFDEDLEQLDHMIAEMGGLCETQLSEAVDALVRRDPELAEKVVAGDKKIDALEQDIDAFAVRLLALRQPVAEDLRMVIAALKVSGNLERVGDYAKNVAKRAITISQGERIGSGDSTIARMARIVQGMIKNVLDAYVARDAELAHDVRLRDEEVDQLHSSLFRELLTYMMEDPRNITTCTHLLFIAKNVERIGDHITSVAEQTIFRVSGVAPEEERPKGDSSSFMTIEPAKPAASD